MRAAPVPRQAVSFVIELENLRRAQADRLPSVLQRLASELRHCAPRLLPPLEVFLVCNQGDSVAGAPETALRNLFRGVTLNVEALVCEGLDYYQMKNAGALRARGDLVIFLDSDVLPDEGWLEAMLSAFDDPAVEVVTGCTYVAPQGLYRKAFALFWFYGLRPESVQLAPTTRFYANNLAFRRPIITAHPFPDLRPRFRGQCAELARRLVAQRVGIFCAAGARVEHPPPKGWNHFLRRALCEGHDTTLELRATEGTPSLVGVWARWRDGQRRAGQRIREQGAGVGLRRREILPAHAIALAYFSLRALGELLARVAPAFLRRHFGI